MLDHPWLNQERNYDYQLSDLDHKKLLLRQGVEDAVAEVTQSYRSIPKPFASKGHKLRHERTLDGNLSDLAMSDEELNNGDREDNISLFSDDKSEISLSGPGAKDQRRRIQLEYLI